MSTSFTLNEKTDRTTRLLKKMKVYLDAQGFDDDEVLALSNEVDEVLANRLKEFKDWGYITEWADGEQKY